MDAQPKAPTQPSLLARRDSPSLSEFENRLNLSSACERRMKRRSLEEMQAPREPLKKKKKQPLKRPREPRRPASDLSEASTPLDILEDVVLEFQRISFSCFKDSKKRPVTLEGQSQMAPGTVEPVMEAVGGSRRIVFKGSGPAPAASTPPAETEASVPTIHLIPVIEEVQAVPEEPATPVEETQSPAEALPASPKDLLQSPKQTTSLQAQEEISSFIREISDCVCEGEFVFRSDLFEALDQQATHLASCCADFDFPQFAEGLIQLCQSTNAHFKSSIGDLLQRFEGLLSKFRSSPSRFPFLPLQPRLYQEITEYKSIFGDSADPSLAAKYSTSKLLRSQMTGTCVDCPCEKPQDEQGFCQYNIMEGGWKSCCKDKEMNVECDANCRCPPACPNRQMQDGRRLKLGEDVEAAICWGIDLFTRNAIFNLMPLGSEHLALKREMMDEILKSLNHLGLEGWNMTAALRILHHDAFSKWQLEQTGQTLPDPQDKIVYRSLERQFRSGGLTFGCFGVEWRTSDPSFRLSGLAAKRRSPWYWKAVGYKFLEEFSLLSQARELFRTHTKGQGIVSRRTSVIPRNSLVTEYFGEVYPAWYWYMKQDAIKNFLSMVKRGDNPEFAKYRNNYSMDFYNITVEKNPEEIGGKDLVIIDPIFNGNFASRLSHSCNPNCCTFPVVSQGQYFIGLYAIRDIQPGEELTFDYCSFTESQKEYEDSVCLCGSEHCHGHYLHYAKKHSNGFLEGKTLADSNACLLDRPHHSFFQGNALILASTCPLTPEMTQFLRTHGFAENVFKDSPDWLKVWAYRTFKLVLAEREALHQKTLQAPSLLSLNDLDDQQKVLKLEIEDLFYQRVHNFLVTIDKAQQFLSKQSQGKAHKPPIRLLKPAEMFDFFKSLLFDLLHKIQVPDKDDRSECLLDFFDEHFGDALFEDLSLQEDLPFVADGGESARAVGSAEPTHPKRFVSGHPALLHQFNETDYFLKAFGELSRKIFHSDKDFGEEGIIISLLEQRRVLGVDWLKLIALKYWVLKLGCRLAAEGPTNRQAADLSFFYAMTSHHFTSQVYDGYGVTVRVRECDLTNPDKLGQKTHQSDESQIANLARVIYSKEK